MGWAESGMQAVPLEGGFGNGALNTDGHVGQLRPAAMVGGDAEQVVDLGLAGDQQCVDGVLVERAPGLQRRRVGPMTLAQARRGERYAGVALDQVGQLGRAAPVEKGDDFALEISHATSSTPRRRPLGRRSLAVYAPADS